MSQTNKKNELIIWASSKIGKPFIWGESDCSTLTLEGISLYYGNIFNLKNIWGSLKKALRAYEIYGTPINILKQAGFISVNKKYEQTGDIFVLSVKNYYLVGVIINQSVLTSDEGKKIVLRPINTFNNYICYRKEISN